MEAQAWIIDSSGGGSMTNGPKYSCAAIREAWEREAKQRWKSQTHGRGSLLIVRMLAPPDNLMTRGTRSPTFEFWRDQKKVRGRLIGVGNGVVVARLNVDGLPE
jgi:hypothetical protein